MFEQRRKSYYASDKMPQQAIAMKSTESDELVDVETIDLVWASDERYSLPLTVSIFSALTNYRGTRPVRVSIIDGGISERSKRTIEKIVAQHRAGIDWINTDTFDSTGLPVRDHFSEAIYYRILLPALMPRASKAIYFDCDVVVREDISPLWAQEIGDNLVMAVRDRHWRTIRDSVLWPCEVVRDVGDKPYFNSGVLVMNLDMWRRDSISDKIYDFIHKWESFVLSDQDGLNAVCVGRWYELDQRWNQWNHYGHVMEMEELEPGGIIHYVGSKKPWQAIAMYDTVIFDHYLNKSGFFSKHEWWAYRSRMEVYRMWLHGKYFLHRSRTLREVVASCKRMFTSVSG